MTVWILLGLISVLLAINIFLWKFGFVHEAEHPAVLEDKPVIDAPQRKALLKRLNRWKEEGKLTREEFEHITTLCDSDWNDT